MNIDPRIVEQFNKRAPFELTERTLLVLAQIGSHSHGTYIKPTDPNAIDDVDYMGIVIPPMNFTLGLREWEGLNFQFEELDCVFYSFRKFVSLLVKSNPNVLGLLWLRPEFYIVQNEEWSRILDSRHLFSSKSAYPSFMGYAHSQLKKMESFDLKTQIEWDYAIELITAAGWTLEQVLEDKHREMPNQAEVINVYKRQCVEQGV